MNMQVASSSFNKFSRKVSPLARNENEYQLGAKQILNLKENHQLSLPPKPVKSD